MIALGAVMVVVGLTLLAIEAHVSTAGLLGLAGVLAAAAGVGVIIVGSGASLAVAIPVAIVLSGLGMFAMVVATRKVVAARRQALRAGPSRLVGAVGTVRTWSRDEGQVAADGTLWRAHVSYGWEDEGPPVPGESVIVEGLNGLTLSIRRRQSWEMDPS